MVPPSISLSNNLVTSATIAADYYSIQVENSHLVVVTNADNIVGNATQNVTSVRGICAVIIFPVVYANTSFVRNVNQRRCLNAVFVCKHFVIIAMIILPIILPSAMNVVTSFVTCVVNHSFAVGVAGSSVLSVTRMRQTQCSRALWVRAAGNIVPFARNNLCGCVKLHSAIVRCAATVQYYFVVSKEASTVVTNVRFKHENGDIQCIDQASFHGNFPPGGRHLQI